MFVYDLTNKKSLHYLNEFHQFHDLLNLQEGRQVPIMLVGNKKDLVDADPSLREVTEEEVLKYVDDWEAVHIETSALTGDNVAAVFEQLIRAVRTKKYARAGGIYAKQPWYSSCDLL